MAVCVRERVMLMLICRRQLSAVQEEYVRLCGEKDKLEGSQVKKMEQVSHKVAQVCIARSVPV